MQDKYSGIRFCQGPIAPERKEQYAHLVGQNGIPI